MLLIQSSYSRVLDHFNVSTSFSRNFSLLFLSNTLNNIAMFIANIVIASHYSREVFGLYSIAATVALTTFSISEFGMNLTMIRLYKLHVENKERASAVLVCNLYFKAAALGLLIVAAVFFGKALSQVFAKSPDHGLMLGVALITGGILGFWSYAKAFFQTYERFQQIASLTIGYALVRLLLIGGIVFIPFTFAPELLFAMVYLVPLLTVLIYGYSIICRTLNFTAVRSVEVFNVLRESLSYSKWVAASGITFVLIQQSIIFMAATIGDLKQVALLNAALVFTSVFSLLNDSWQQVVLPKVAALTKDGMTAYRSKVFRFLPWFFLFSLLAVVFLSAVMSFMLGAQYGESLPIFWLTSFGAATTIACGFFSILMHSIQRPEISFYVNLVTLIIVVSVGSMLMLKVGLLGMIAWYACSIVTGELVKAVLIDKHAQRL